MQHQDNKAILIALGTPRNAIETQEHLDELSFLAETVGIRTIEQFIQNLTHPDTRFFVGKGKLAEIRDFVVANKVTNVIFDDDLSPSQLPKSGKGIQSAGFRDTENQDL
jgi:GTP-binding protein HflX